MHFLECIAMLRYLEKKLQANQRDQVSVQLIPEVLSVIVQVNKKLEGSLPPGNQYLQVSSDLMHALYAIQQTAGITYLTDSMKNTVVDGIRSLQDELCVFAYKYFTVNKIPDDVCKMLETDDGTDTTSSMSILRKVAEVAINNGLYKQ